MRVSLERAEGTRRMCRKVGMMRPAGVRARAVRRSQRPGSEGIWSLFITALQSPSCPFHYFSFNEHPSDAWHCVASVWYQRRGSRGMARGGRGGTP